MQKFLLLKNQNIFLNNKNLFLSSYNKVLLLNLPSKFYIKSDQKGFSLLFINKFFYISFIKNLSNIFFHKFSIFYIKFKLRGLGFRIKKISLNLFKFFFTSVNFLYLHVPVYSLVKSRGRKLFILSCDYSSIRRLLTDILLLKRIIVYKFRGLSYPKQLI